MEKSIFSGWRMIVILFAIFFTLAGFGALYLKDANDKNDRRLTDEGATSLATITRKHTTVGHNTNRKASGTRRYVLDYSFPLAASGKVWKGNDEVSEADYDSVEVGDKFDVRYWSKDPDIATIIGDAYAAGAQLLKTISTILFSFAALMGLLLLIQPVRKAPGGKR